MVIIKKEVHRNCGGRSQNKDVKMTRGIIVINQNRVLDRRNVSALEGSKDEKISIIIQDLKIMFTFITLKVISLFNLKSLVVEVIDRAFLIFLRIGQLRGRGRSK